MKILKSLTAVSGYTIGSRVFGFLRETITASLLGSGAAADALIVAIKLPSLLRRLLAEGAFNAAFVPMFAGMIAKEGKDSAKNFAEEVFSVLVIILMALVIIVEFAMPWLLPVFVPLLSPVLSSWSHAGISASARQNRSQQEPGKRTKSLSKPHKRFFP